MNKLIRTFIWLPLLIFALSCSTSDDAPQPIDPDPDPDTMEPEPSPEPEPIIEVNSIAASAQRIGDANVGYEFLTSGDYMASGVPYEAFVRGFGEDNTNLLGRTGDNAALSFEYSAVDAPNGVRIVSPNCMSCHAGFINDEFIIGLGNHSGDFTINRADDIPLVSAAISFLYGGQESDEWKAYDQFRKGILAIGPKTITETLGMNPADKITQVLVSHRDKTTLAWLDEPLVEVDDVVIPTDVPAWWMLKKKNAMFYHGIGRRDFCKSFIGSSLLTLTDKDKAEELDDKMADVLAYIYSLEPPSYPFEIDNDLASSGKLLFEENCAKCHGTYGAESSYPNLMVSLKTIGTDPALSNRYSQSSTTNDYFLDWFNTGWFGTDPEPLQIIAEGGYIAPLLDGVWATAPYLHNGSVPTIADLLNSTTRPKYWSRTYDSTDYDPQKLGWQYAVETGKADKKTYDTTLKGHNNEGHTFGDLLTDDERNAVLEYLKTL